MEEKTNKDFSINIEKLIEKVEIINCPYCFKTQMVSNNSLANETEKILKAILRELDDNGASETQKNQISKTRL